MNRFHAIEGQRGTAWQLRVVALALAGASTSLSAGSLQIYGNSAAMTINDNAPASLYPSVINVNTIPGNVITKATVRLIGLSHSWPNDMDIVLVAPDGTRSILMSDAGGGAANALSNENLTFSATAPTRTPRDTKIDSAVPQRPRPTPFLAPGLARCASSPRISTRSTVSIPTATGNCMCSTTPPRTPAASPAAGCCR